MFELAIFIGIYSYLIFALGILGLLYKSYIIFLTIVYVATILLLKVAPWYKVRPWDKVTPFLKNSKLIILLLIIIFSQAAVNFIGALGPEHGFDALWYHLTLPKIYLLNHKIEYIPGGLLYYSAMPQLTEMLYTSALALNGEILAQFTHFLFGLLSLAVLYKLSRKFLSTTFSLLAVVIFYSNLVVAWESITAYIDLARTFFEISALLAFVNWLEEKQKNWFVLSGVLLGLAVSTKLIAFGSLLIFSILIINKLYNSQKKDWKSITANILAYWYICIAVVSPWFVYSFIYTGNPVYPFFTNIYPTNFDISLLNPIRFFRDLWKIFVHADDPMSPIYIIALPLLVYFYKKFDSRFKPIILYSVLSIFVWYITPRTGGGRFLLPYLPALSLITAIVIDSMSKENKLIKNFLITTVILIAISIMLYRGIANSRYIPVIIGKETKEQFLSNHLNFSFGDFYDVDGYFKNNIKPSEKVLLYGFHNLYYIDFPFVDSSWVKKGDEFSHIASQNSIIPDRFSKYTLLYYNSNTKVKLYGCPKLICVY